MVKKTRTEVAGYTALRNLVGALLLMGGLALPMALPATEAPVEAEINALLEVVAKSGCDFKRNGTLHASPDAAEHLALKYSRGRRYVETTEDFIDLLATKSSWSGRSYAVICNGVETASGTWLHVQLLGLRNSAPNTVTE
ncbi:MAG: DUF5329 domain-containing protein [Luminiphilus sp.]|jgi:hypothetical protein|nr:DUF5329 domain-containing protein [Luminiphilus sp.]MDG1460103.1 DUF5329 domain-containing protein [Luminiphilus sp.]MDG1771500.1 DUF5329 domain-containing protein [Luminiphilus sp.]